MPNLNDLATLADSLEKPKIAVVQERCVKVRNRNATCQRCQEACQADALSIVDNQVRCATALCVDCGACVVACPTEALRSVGIDDQALLAAVRDCRDRAEGDALVACARIAARHGADPLKYVEVPCLGRIDQSLLLSLAADGDTRHVDVIDGDCATCKFGQCSPLIDGVVGEVNHVLAAQGRPLRVRRAQVFPPSAHFQDEKAADGFGASRRGFFTEAASAVKETTMMAARASLAERLGTPTAPGLGERLRVGQDGTLPQFPMPRHERAIDAIDAMGAPQNEVLEGSLFGRVAIDGAACNACGMCATFCPTGALARSFDDRGARTLSALEFLACDCVQCGLCVDVCWKDCLELDSAVPMAQLFDFEPVSFDVTARPGSGAAPFKK